MRPEAHWPADYAAARDAFRRAAEARGAHMRAWPVPARGPGGEELTVDSAYLGPEGPRRLLVVSSGIHGVEAYAGSALQHRLLAEALDALSFADDTGCLLVHALNPYGFAWTRRVNESNVDLNRNFLRHPHEHVPNPEYDALAPHVNPERFDAESEREHLGALMAFAQEHGERRLQEVLTRGQYRHPRGVQFGGERDEASALALREIAAQETRGAERIVWIDVHTGLGHRGEVELISEEEPDHPAARRGVAWYGERARSTRSGESVSAPLHGTIERGVQEVLPGDVELTMHTAEFGTVDAVQVFLAMRADNWLFHHGDRESEQGRAIRAGLLDAFCPGDAHWRSRVLEEGLRVLGLAARGLAAGARAPGL